MLFSYTMSIFDPIIQCTSVFCIVLGCTNWQCQTFTWYKIGWCKLLTLCQKLQTYVLIQKVTFSTEKELLTQPYTIKPCINAQNLCVHQSNNAVFTHPFFWVHRDFSVSTQCLPFTTILSWLAKLSCLLIDFSVLTQGCVSACVKSFFWLRRSLSR